MVPRAAARARQVGQPAGGDHTYEGCGPATPAGSTETGWRSSVSSGPPPAAGCPAATNRRPSLGDGGGVDTGGGGGLVWLRTRSTPTWSPTRPAAYRAAP